ncbi:MAG: MiaB/RimO family radical SAM methylthiotransferase [Firmicutes bacterium]|nr:MiaB/RimO family radical SAM methylthiotransferase [Bacillota bacterium]
MGCPVNQSESAVLEALMTQAGFQETAGRAEVYIINSCVVTGSAAAEARRIVRQIKRESPEAMVVLAGCYPQVYHSGLAGQLPEADIITGVKDRRKLPELIRRRLAGGTDSARVLVEEHNDNDSFEAMPAKLAGHYRRLRPAVKIQEGCNEHCTYCIVRKARGRSRSLPAAKVLAQVRALLEQGHREIILVGNQLGLYGLDLGDTSLPDIIQAVSRLGDNFRIRLGYVEPMNVTEKLLSTVAENPQVCNYLYLPVQSCADRVLEKMGRRYRVDDFIHLVVRARELMPGLAIWTDLIAGFPGETSDDHQATMTIISKLALSRLHVFPYSARPGTSGAGLANNLPPDVKKVRAAQLRQLGRELTLSYHQTQVGQKERVLVEKIVTVETGRRYAEGYGDNYVPVSIPMADSAICRPGTLVTVRLKQVADHCLNGILE